MEDVHALAVALVAAVTAAFAPTASGPGLAVRLPPGWQQAPASLTPQLLDPRERLSVGTYPLRYRALGCSHMPSSALADLGPTDALITIQERGRGEDFPPRPAHFGAQPDDNSEAAECVPGSTFTDHWQTFGDGGRNFHVLVAFGSRASETTRAQAWQILDHLQVDPRVRPDWDSSG
jgi:hypothetical protein